MTEAILVGDIGGTHARFALASPTASGFDVSAARTLVCADFSGPIEAMRAYLAQAPQAASGGCVAAAALLDGDAVAFVNAPWRFTVSGAQVALGLGRLVVVNDLHALAAGVYFMPEAAFETIRSGDPDATAPAVVIGVGTGFGQALIVPGRNGVRTIVPTEGGHVAFAPSNDEEIELLRRLAKTYGRVSIERLASGPGLHAIYAALCDMAGTASAHADTAAVAAAARAGGDDLAASAVARFFAILGGIAGDAVLAAGARGGVVLGGGALQRMRDFFPRSEFIKRFLDKGRVRPFLAAAPIRLLTDERASLYGAASVYFESQRAA